LPFESESFDLAYSIESLCHALDPTKALSEAARVVRPGGKFLIVDAWRTDEANMATERQRSAMSLVEKSMAVENIPSLNEAYSRGSVEV
jgi:ubiquinone/menaquinone biosynthesis C-methylase UbiE